MIRVALILDVEYPTMDKAFVSLLTADGPSSGFNLFYDNDRPQDQQPVGQVDLYLSDFVGSASVPAAFCRPSTAELASGVARFVNSLYRVA